MAGATLALVAGLLVLGAVVLYPLERQRQLDAALLQTYEQAEQLRGNGRPYSVQLKTARDLIRNGASVRHGKPVDWAALVWAVECSPTADDSLRLSLMSEILEHGGDVNEQSWGISALGSAASLGDPAGLAFLLKRGADPNLTSDGKTPLRLAEGPLSILEHHGNQPVNEQVVRRRIRDYRTVIHLLRQAGARP